MPSAAWLPGETAAVPLPAKSFHIKVKQGLKSHADHWVVVSAFPGEDSELGKKTSSGPWKLLQRAHQD